MAFDLALDSELKSCIERLYCKVFILLRLRGFGVYVGNELVLSALGGVFVSASILEDGA